MTESTLTTLLRQRYPKPEYAFMPQVRNGTGFSRRTTRTADGVALSLYPSRGIHLHGFEIKVTRSDWKRELADPDKAESICQYCNFWWVVAPDGVVPMDELPPTWGLLVPNGDSKLKAVKQAKELVACAIDMTQIAAIFRAAQKVVASQAEIDIAVEFARKEERERAAKEYESARYREREEHRNFVQQVHDFENRAGISIANWRGKNSAEAFRFVMDGGLAAQREVLKTFAERSEQIASYIRSAIVADPAEIQEARP